MKKHPLSLTNESFGDVKQKSLVRIKELEEKHSLQVTVICEHEWGEMMINEKVLNFLKVYDFPERIDPHDALFGGGTNALNLNYAVQPGEKNHSFDFTSLYPYVNKTKTYPIGHPIIIFRDFKPLGNYFGIIRNKILSPKQLWLPI